MTETVEWSNLSPCEQAGLAKSVVMADNHPEATAAAVQAYLLVKYGWSLVVYEHGLVEFGKEGIGPAGFARADSTEEAILLAALRSVGVCCRYRG